MGDARGDVVHFALQGAEHFARIGTEFGNPPKLCMHAGRHNHAVTLASCNRGSHECKVLPRGEGNIGCNGVFELAGWVTFAGECEVVGAEFFLAQNAQVGRNVIARFYAYHVAHNQLARRNF